MLENSKKMVVIISLLILIIISITIAYGSINKSKNISPKPTPQSPIRKKDDLPEEKWYIQFTAKQQMTTAYTGGYSTSEPRPSSGHHYFIGTIAVHPRHPGCDHRIPIIPFGTLIYPRHP